MEPLNLCIDPTLPATAMRVMAEHLEKIARAYRLKAAELETWSQLSSQPHTPPDIASTVPAAIQRHLDAGLTLRVAFDLAALETEACMTAIRLYWKHHRRKEIAQENADRARAVMQLAQKGLTNTQIGQRMNLHPGSVSRLISKALGRSTG